MIKQKKGFPSGEKYLKVRLYSQEIEKSKVRVHSKMIPVWERGGLTAEREWGAQRKKGVGRARSQILNSREETSRAVWLEVL